MFGLHWLSLGIGVGLGVAGTCAWRHYHQDPAWTPSGKGADGVVGGKARLHGKISPGPVGSPQPPGTSPRPGVASLPTYEWGYLVGPGDSSGEIAEAITGDDGRYTELLLANPHLESVGEPGVYLGAHAWDFAPDALVEGQGLLLPLTWSRYIDQTGRPRGGPVPFPRDPRGADLLETAATPPALGAATRGGDAPYDEPFQVPEAA